jgi:Fur family peroxide stress response transcriptional regulator
MTPSHSLLCRIPPSPGPDSSSILSPSAIKRDSEYPDQSAISVPGVGKILSEVVPFARVTETHYHFFGGAVPEQRFRNTTQRAEVLDEVRRSQSHLTAGEIFERVRRRDPRIAYGTVYRTLHLLAEHGLIQELTFADQASRYDGRVERHDHVHCLECGVLLDVDVPVALMALHVAAEQSGFDVNSHHTVFSGRCPGCKSVESRPKGDRQRPRGLSGAELTPQSAATSS